MSSWSVVEVAQWLEGLGMDGPASSLRAHCVNGEDLFKIRNAEEFCDGQEVIPFCCQQGASPCVANAPRRMHSDSFAQLDREPF